MLKKSNKFGRPAQVLSALKGSSKPLTKPGANLQNLGSRMSGALDNATTTINQFLSGSGNTPTLTGLSGILSATGKTPADLKSFAQSNPLMAAAVLKDPSAVASNLKAQNAPKSNLAISGTIAPPGRTSLKDMGLTAPDISGSVSAMQTSIQGFEAAIKAMEDANAPMLKGEIPGDVAAQVRMNAAETAAQGGLGTQSQAARNLTARDLGTTSLQIQQQGIANQATIASSKQAAADINRMVANFNQTLQVQQQQLVEDARRTDLTAADLNLRRQIHNSTVQYNLIKLIGDLATANAQYQTSMAINGGDTSGISSIFAPLISQVNSVIAQTASNAQGSKPK